MRPCQCAQARGQLIILEAAGAEIKRLTQRILDHDNACLDACGHGDQEGVECGYRPYLPRRCPTCPIHDIIGLADE